MGYRKNLDAGYKGLNGHPGSLGIDAREIWRGLEAFPCPFLYTVHTEARLLQIKGSFVFLFPTKSLLA